MKNKNENKESSELFVHLALVRLKSLTASSLSSLEACISMGSSSLLVLVWGNQRSKLKELAAYPS